MIQLTRTGVLADAEEITSLRERFARDHCVVLPQLLHRDLLGSLMRSLEAARFVEKMHYAESAPNQPREFAKDISLVTNSPAWHAWHLLMNTPGLFKVMEQITESPEIGSFTGRIYRTLPGSDHHLDWHSDLNNNRLIGLSLNLSPEPYVGGVFQIRERVTQQVTAEVGSSRPGCAHLFRIAQSVEHRVTAVEDRHPRTAAAGWFVSTPSREARLKSLFTT
ncbi:MAG TPA: 2OG-Fe(II) oxygenase [Blastocatellia bacterium]|nr:2OG-Fe(II) oxygenase [Blastocatellia bacterium]